ncbi:MAG: ABC transporter permease subunit [Eubacteriales bacterium]|nr:ABC transporter permease subunit [Eubacteriales bacterium]
MNKRPAKSRFMIRMRKDWQLHLLLLLPLTVLLIYNYLPMTGIVMAFQNYKPAKGIWGSTWVGLKNFRLLFSMQGFLYAIRNSFTIAIAKIVLNVAVPVSFALLLNEMRNAQVKKTVQTIVYMPHFISWVLMASIVIRLLSYNGVVNKALEFFGGEKQIFLANKKMFQPIIVITDVWKEFGYGTIIYLAAMAGVDSDLYEAAAIDGAGYWKRMLHVTLPAIYPTIVLMSTLALGRILDAGFDQIFNLYSPAVYETADIIDTFVYRMAFTNMQYSMSTAAGLMKNVVSCALILVSYRLAYRLTGYRIF